MNAEVTLQKLRDLVAKLHEQRERIGKPVNLNRDRASAFVTPSGEVITILPIKRHRKTQLMVTGAVQIQHCRLGRC